MAAFLHTQAIFDKITWLHFSHTGYFYSPFLARGAFTHTTSSFICRFATTIHVLCSAVLKLMQSGRLPAGMLLYRGFSGGRLPASFSKADAHGLRGFAEWGFLSTTAVRGIAVQAR